MTTTHTNRHLHLHNHTGFASILSSIIFVLTVMILAAPPSRAIELGNSFFLAGIGTGKIEGSARDTSMTTYYGIINHKIKDGLVALDLRGTYTYGDLSGNSGGSMNDADVNLYLSFSKIPIVKPFAIGGVSYDKFSLPREFRADHGWNLAYNLGVGAEVHVLPALPITGMIVYTSGDYERVNYVVDATFWFTKFGIGAYLNYQHGQGDFGDNDIRQGSVYAAFRF